jgi:dihydrofolate synthase/folylpolyglutamate synthase
MHLPNLKIELQGMYQKKNTITLIQSVEILKELGFEIAPVDLYNGLRKTIEQTGIQGRWQTVDYHPRIILDCAHNADGMQEVIRQTGHTAFENLHMIIGFVNDKDVRNILRHLPLNATYYFTRSTVPRSMHEDELKLLAGAFGLKGDSFSSIHTAIQAARKKALGNDLVIITGSMFLVADFLSQKLNTD